MLTGMNKGKWEEYDRGICNGCAAKSSTKQEISSSIFKRRCGIERAAPVYASTTELSSENAKFFSKSVTDLTEILQRRNERRWTKSLTDLTSHAALVPGGNHFAQSTRRAENVKKNEAGRRVVNLLLLNAWRRRREDNEEARAIVKTLSNEVGSLNMQAYVLRQLLDSKKANAISSAKDLRKLLSKIEKLEEEKKSILKAKESLEFEVKDLQDAITDLQSKCKNLENDLNTARLEAGTWEANLKKERKKLKAAKEENATLQKEGESKEYQLDYQSRCLEELKYTVKNLQEELDTQVPLLKEAMAQIQSAEEKLKLSDKMQMEQERIIIEKDMEIKRLEAEVAEAERKFWEQDEINGELRKIITEKAKEMAIINDKLAELARSEKFWAKRIVKMACLCTRIPAACFYTVATLLLPQPWYRLL